MGRHLPAAVEPVGSLYMLGNECSDRRTGGNEVCLLEFHGGREINGESVEWIMEKMVLDMTWKEVSRQEYRGEGYQFQFRQGEQQGGQLTWWALH